MTVTRTRDEAGVTLIELLVSVSLLGLLMSALSGALFVGLRTTNDTQTSLGQSNAEQLVSTYLTKDIQAAASQFAPPGRARAATRRSCSRRRRARTRWRRATSPLRTRFRARTSCGRCADRPPSVHTIAHNVTSLSASGTNPVSITVATAPSAKVGAYSWTLEVRRRQT